MSVASRSDQHNGVRLTSELWIRMFVIAVATALAFSGFVAAVGRVSAYPARSLGWILSVSAVLVGVTTLLFGFVAARAIRFGWKPWAIARLAVVASLVPAALEFVQSGGRPEGFLVFSAGATVIWAFSMYVVVRQVHERT